nr:SPOR domain-containing protein [Desulfobulbaceae bacterium]
MATKKKTTKKVKKPLVSIELGVGGLLGLLVSSFCIFLWMFLFGLWTGQSVLQTSESSDKAKDLPGFASKMWHKRSEAQITRAESTSEKSPEEVRDPVVKSENETAASQDASFFAVQVSAFKDQHRAEKAVQQWRDKKYNSFYLMPDPPDGKFHRVFVGHFDSLAEANSLAATLESVEQRKVFIMLVAADQKQLP